jgi:hypothetical protein
MVTASDDRSNGPINQINFNSRSIKYCYEDAVEQHTLQYALMKLCAVSYCVRGIFSAVLDGLHVREDWESRDRFPPWLLKSVVT